MREVDLLQFLTELGACKTGEFPELVGITRDEERRIAFLQSELGADRLGPLWADIVGKRTCALTAFAPHDVAESGLAFALRPGVHTVAERTRAATLAGDRPHLVLGVFQHPREHFEARAAEMLRDHLHLDRIAQVRLVG